jgi:hypothetical protein
MTQSSAVDRLLDLIATGRGGDAADLYAPDAVLDATVPGWRFQKHGGTAIAGVWEGWFDAPGELQELERTATPDGEVVSYLQTAVDEGTPFAAHHCHVLALDPASRLVRRHLVWCGGRWSEGRLQEMAEAQRANGELAAQA